MPVQVTKDQYTLLNALGSASDDLRTAAARIQATTTDDLEHMDKGYMVRGISHQTMVEYFEAKAKVEALSRLCGSSFGAELQAVTTAVYTRGSNAVWDRTLVTLQEAPTAEQIVAARWDRDFAAAQAKGGSLSGAATTRRHAGIDELGQK